MSVFRIFIRPVSFISQLSLAFILPYSAISHSYLPFALPSYITKPFSHCISLDLSLARYLFVYSVFFLSFEPVSISVFRYLCNFITSVFLSLPHCLFSISLCPSWPLRLLISLCLSSPLCISSPLSFDTGTSLSFVACLSFVTFPSFGTSSSFVLSLSHPFFPQTKVLFSPRYAKKHSHVFLFLLNLKNVHSSQPS